MPADIRLGDIRAWEISDVPGVRLYIAIPKGKINPRVWFELNGQRSDLGSLLTPDKGQLLADFLDSMADQINRALEALTEKHDDTENENKA